MGHEIAHAVAQHGRSRMATQVATQGGLAAVQAALSLGTAAEGEDSTVRQATLAALGLGAQLGTLAFGRGDESHADELGLRFMAMAGYDPREAVKFWERMAAASGGASPPEFLSTHPSHDTRIADLEKLMPDALEIYRQSAGQ